MDKFGKGYWKTFDQGLQREWVITNGIGGYAGDSIIGVHTRKHHGILIASLHPPVERYLVVSRIQEELVIGEKSFSFSAVQRRGHRLEEGQLNQQRFCFDAVPTYVYHVEDVHLTRTLAMEYGHNTTVISYEIRNGSKPAVLRLSPCFNYREHGEGSTKEQLFFHQEMRKKGDGIELCLTPEANPEVKIYLYCSEGRAEEREKNCYDEKLELQTEIDTGMSSEDNNYVPYDISLALEPFQTKQITITASIEPEYPIEGLPIIEAARERSKKLMKQAQLAWSRHYGKGEKKTDFAQYPLFNKLVQAADCFITDRQSTGCRTILAGLPWFTDWGRDTMIAMQGLTLVTGRLEDAKGILRTFVRYRKDGLVPNMFPDEGLEPLYNTVDASLWYFHAVDQYLKYADSPEEYEFVQKEIYPGLKEIIHSYREGTAFSIYMDMDSLIHAGGGFDQVTWMDVRVGEWVVTPRHGKPVEINALWYNALKVMAALAKRFGDSAEEAACEELAQKVRESFCNKFWNGEKNCLFDVVDEEPITAGEMEQHLEVKTQNAQIRPNQIYAVSLPYTMLDRQQEEAVVNTVFSHLYATYGLRSLSPEDAEYKGSYKGELHDRDAAYHQGTAWAFPLGAFITAYAKVHNHSKECTAYLKELVEVMEDHLRDGCIGQIAEIFDGDEPHISRGCYGQAWSVGEILRAYGEDILPYEI